MAVTAVAAAAAVVVVVLARVVLLVPLGGGIVSCAVVRSFVRGGQCAADLFPAVALLAHVVVRTPV